jgi:hypothetical protein
MASGEYHGPGPGLSLVVACSAGTRDRQQATRSMGAGEFTVHYAICHCGLCMEMDVGYWMVEHKTHIELGYGNY